MSDEAQIDSVEVARDIDALESSQERLVQHLRSLEAADPASPSLLPDWTVGHVLTHIARNADSMLRMLAGLSQYWMGLESRASDIELGARRAWDELVEDVDSTGVAAVQWMLGPQVGSEQTVRAAAAGLPPVPFTAVAGTEGVPLQLATG